MSEAVEMRLSEMAVGCGVLVSPAGSPDCSVSVGAVFRELPWNRRTPNSAYGIQETMAFWDVKVQR